MEPAATLDQAAKVLAYFKDESREQVQALLMSGLLADVRDANFNEPINRDAVRKLLGLKPLNPPLLEEVGTVTVPANADTFVVRDNNIEDGAPVKVSFLGDNFQEWFGSKTEEPQPETNLRYSELTRPSLDGPILAELGDKARTALSQIYWLMAQQPNGEEGVLLTDGWANIFYVDGRVVNLYWDGGGWYVDAGSVEYPYGWYDGCRVFSSNS